jgi:enoyl-[acyl-carrier protein] reductase I
MSTMKLLENKIGLVFGLANDRSIAWHIARNAMEHGAACGFPYLPGEKMERRVKKTLEDGGVAAPWLYPCDVSRDDDVDSLFTAVANHFGRLDFVVHSIAYAARPSGRESSPRRLALRSRRLSTSPSTPSSPSRAARSRS